MNRIPNQFFGIGDCLFLIPLIRKWQSQGDKILWPIIPEYLNIQKSFPDIEFCDKTKLHINYDCRTRFTWNNWTVEPLRWADLYKGPPANCMRAKYDLYDEDFMMWRELAWKRDEATEQILYDMVVQGVTQYNLISDRWGSIDQGQFVVPMHIDNGLPNVYLRNIPGFSLLDWAKVIENATYIHTVGSSINYMLDVMDLKAKEVHVYRRAPREKGFIFYDYLLTKKYHFHL